MRLSLSGFQDKAAVCIQDDRIFIPGPGVPTTHILKPTHPELIDLLAKVKNVRYLNK